MPSISLRRRKYWIQYFLPGCSRPIRQSLGVEDRAQAERMSSKLESLLALIDPRLADIQLPPAIMATLPSLAISGLKAPILLPEPSTAEGDIERPSSSSDFIRTSIPEAVAGYYKHICESNDKRWISVKVKVLRVLFGDPLVVAATGRTLPRGEPEVGMFKGSQLEEITSTLLGALVSSRLGRGGKMPAADKTKRHYREVLHDFFEYCLSHSLMQVRNLHTPNPVIDRYYAGFLHSD